MVPRYVARWPLIPYQQFECCCDIHGKLESISVVTDYQW